MAGTWLFLRLVEQRTQREHTVRARNRLFDKQLEAHEALWRALRPAASDWSEHTVLVPFDGEVRLSRANAQQLCEALTDLYHAEHGLYLSKGARRSVFRARNHLRKVLDKHGNEFDPVPIDEGDQRDVAAVLVDLVQRTRADVSLRALRVSMDDVQASDESLKD